MRFDISRLKSNAKQLTKEQEQLRKQDRTLMDLMKEREEKKKMQKRAEAGCKQTAQLPLLIRKRL